MRSKIYASTLAILLGLATPIVSSIVFPGVVIAQTVEERKKEAEQLFKQGSQYFQTDQLDLAIHSWLQALQIYREIKDTRREGNVLGNLGGIYLIRKDYSKAIELYEKSLVIARNIKDHSGEGYALSNLGRVYDALANYTKAIEFHEQSLAIFSEIKDRKLEGVSLGNLGSTYNSLGNYQKAIEYHERRLIIAQELKDLKSVRNALGNLGNAYSSLENHLKAIKFHEQSLEISYSLKDRQAQINSLGKLGDAYYVLGNYYRMIELQEIRFSIAYESNNKQGMSDSLGSLGLAYYSLGNYDKAIEFQEKGLVIAREIKNRISEVVILGNISNIHFELNNYDKSIKFQENSLLISREIKYRSGEGECLINMASIYGSLGNNIKAIEFYQQGLEILRELGDQRGESFALNGLGGSYHALGKHDKAMEFLEKSLNISRSINNRAGEISSLEAIGDNYLLVGKNSKAIEFYEQSLILARYIKSPSYERKALGKIGIAFFFLGNYGKAIDYQEQSLLISRQIKSLKGMGTNLNNLGVSLKKDAKIFEAEKILFEAIKVWESLRFQVGNNDQNKVSIFEEQARTYRTLQEIQITLQKIKPALEISDRGRSRALVELMSVRLSREPIEKQKIENLSIAQIQNVAKTQNATLIQYSIIPDEKRYIYLYIYITQPNGQVSFRKVDLTKLKQPIAELVNAGRDAIGTRGRGDFVANIPENILQEAQAKRDAQRDRNLRELHQLLIEPIADLLPKTDTENVIFMPQGELFLVPFPALLDTNNQPLITKHTILTAPSIQTLDLTHKTAQARPKGDRPTLVVGNPTMPSISTVIGDKPIQLSDLPGAETEANTIATQLNTKAITGANAKKDTVVKQMQTAGIIHLATHGLLDSFKGDTPGAIALAPNGTGDRNDGLLTSGEIFDLKLTADLVVLSACDTGRGDITGDGVIGLSRSLFVAGVPSVIVSLWKVPDESTAFLMTEFYKNWKDLKLTKAQSLRQAMLTTRTKYSRPLDWAAFTLIGEAE